METIRIKAEANGARLDSFLSEGAGMTRSAAQKLIAAGAVTVNGVARDKNYRLAAGDALACTVPEPVPLAATPENIPLDIVYEDGDLLVVNKPKGMVVHPAPGNPCGTLVNALLYHCGGSLSGINGVIRPGIVHRIDKDTSGLLIVAKNDAAHTALAAQIQAHSFTRLYEAIVVGRLKDEAGTVDAPLGRSPADRKKMAVLHTENARNAVTHYRVLERFDGYTRAEFRLETGRTHQIRVHMASVGHPILGDAVYGSGKNPLEVKYRDVLGGQCLHAKTIGFVHPTTKEYMEFTAPLPAYFETVLAVLEERHRLTLY